MLTAIATECPARTFGPSRFAVADDADFLTGFAVPLVFMSVS